MRTAPLALGMVLMAGGLVAIAEPAAAGYGGTLLGLVPIGAGCAIANPAMAHAVMSAIPPDKAGVGAGINGTLAESGNGLGQGRLTGAVAVLAGGFVAAGLLRRAERTAAWETEIRVCGHRTARQVWHRDR